MVIITIMMFNDCVVVIVKMIAQTLRIDVVIRVRIKGDKMIKKIKIMKIDFVLPFCEVGDDVCRVNSR